MAGLRDELDEVVTGSGFSGAVRVDVAGSVEVDVAYGLADRAHAVANTVDTRFAIASGTKTLTALTVMSLVEQGVLDLRTSARSLLGTDLPLVAQDVTVVDLLAHRSGIGDYLDEDAIEDITQYVMPVPVHQLASTEEYLQVLEGHRSVFAAGERFAYNNAGYVVLALLAERASGVGFPGLVRARVCRPAGMGHTGFLRLDELPGDVAVGYLHADGLRTNVLHLPVMGSGDGGVYSSTADLSALWSALADGRIVSPQRVAQMLRGRSRQPGESAGYGLGFHLDAESDTAWLEGHDAGVSFVSFHRPSIATTCTVMSNWTDGAWPVARLLRQRLRL